MSTGLTLNSGDEVSFIARWRAGSVQECKAHCPEIADAARQESRALFRGDCRARLRRRAGVLRMVRGNIREARSFVSFPVLFRGRLASRLVAAGRATQSV